MGHRAADVVHDDVEPAELARRRRRPALDRVDVGQVGGHDHGATAERRDLRRDLVELRQRCGRR